MKRIFTFLLTLWVPLLLLAQRYHGYGRGSDFDGRGGNAGRLITLIFILVIVIVNIIVYVYQSIKNKLNSKHDKK